MNHFQPPSSNQPYHAPWWLNQINWWKKFPYLSGEQQWKRNVLFPGVIYGLALCFGCGIATASRAAERLTVRFGPVQQSVAIADLEQFAYTGTIPAALRSYSPLLTSDLRQALTSYLPLDPQVGDAIVADLLNSSAGKRLLDTLEITLPDSNPHQLRAALMASTRSAEGLSFLSFLKEFPAETVTIDVSSAIALASQMNLPYWQSQALSSTLERELTVPNPEPFHNSIDPTQTGYQWVRQQTITFRDYRRSRIIPVDLYWSRHTHGPLVVISHGFGADRRFLGYLAYHLASYGFTVAALEHPASNVTWLTEITAGTSHTGRLADILPATEFIDRPADISFLLNELDRFNRYSSTLQGKFNTSQVTVIGHSLGGYTALALAGAKLDLKQLRQFCTRLGPAGLSPADWLQCTAADLPGTGQLDLRDQRIVQVIALNPIIGRLFTDQSLAEIRVPTLILSGTDDAITPAVSQQLLPFSQFKTTKYLLTAIGGSHLSVGDPANLNYALMESLFVRERPGTQTTALRTLLRGVSLAFIAQLTPQAKRYQPFLTPAYAQSFSTSTLQLRLNQELPPNLSNWLKVAALPLEQLVASSLQRQAEHRWKESTYYASISDLFSQFPLVMFILPGSLPLLGKQLLKFQGRKDDPDWQDPRLF